LSLLSSMFISTLITGSTLSLASSFEADS
jgi:hypothetical protein